MNRVAVAFICDENFAMPTYVAIDSLKKSKAQDTAYVIYVVTTGLKETTGVRFESLAESDVEVVVLSAEAAKYGAFEKTFKNKMSNVNTAAFLKFDLPNLLPQEDVCLYLDGDIFVKADLSEYYMTPLGDNYVAAVMDSSSLYTIRDLPVECPLYFNTGVMLLNLKKMREDNLTESLIQTKLELANTRLMDQDVFNIVMVNRAVPMPIRYNFMYTNLEREKHRYKLEEFNAVYNTDYNSLSEIFADSVIVHFSGKDKPWETVDISLQDEWFSYFNCTEYRSELGCDENEQPVISIVIPSLSNTYDALIKTLKSIALQLESCYEVLVVAKQYPKCAVDDEMGSNKIRFVEVDTENYNLALRQGFSMSKGKYIMVVDSGNTLMPNALTYLKALVEAEEYDVIEYRTEVWNEFGLNREKRILETNSQIKSGGYIEDPIQSLITAKGVLPVFWNRLVKRNLYEAIIQTLPQEMWQHPSFALIGICSLYIQANTTLSTEYQIQRFCLNRNPFCTYKTISEFQEYVEILSVENVLNLFGTEDRVAKAKYLIRKYLVYLWLEELMINDAPHAFDVLYEKLGLSLVNILSAEFSNNQMNIARRIQNSSFATKKSGRRIKRIGFFYHNIYNGGIQRVVSLLARIFVENGYEVVIFSDEAPSEGEYPIPAAVHRCVLPDSRIYRNKLYEPRGTALTEALESYNIDILLNNAWESGTMLWDTLVAKTVNVPVIAHVHNIDALWFRNMKQPKHKTEIYKLLDAAVVLSRVEEMFFGQFTNAYYIPNPCSFGSFENIKVSSLEENTVLWLARMDSRKHPEHIVHAFSEIIKKVPDARLILVGGGDEEVRNKTEDLITWYGLQERIELHGFSANVEEYYERASVFVMTSYHEGYPMTLIESKAYGIPTVIYDMPYLEMLRENQGMTIIEPGNLFALETAVVDLLQNKSKRKQMGIDARTSVEKFTDDLILNMWRTVFCDIENQVGMDKDITARIMLENIMEYHEEGVEKSSLKLRNDNEKLVKQCNMLQKEKGERWHELQALKKENTVLQSELKQSQVAMQQITNSRTYRLAGMIAKLGRPFMKLFRR